MGHSPIGGMPKLLPSDPIDSLRKLFFPNFSHLSLFSIQMAQKSIFGKIFGETSKFLLFNFQISSEL